MTFSCLEWLFGHFRNHESRTRNSDSRAGMAAGSSVSRDATNVTMCSHILCLTANTYKNARTQIHSTRKVGCLRGNLRRGCTVGRWFCLVLLGLFGTGQSGKEVLRNMALEEFWPRRTPETQMLSNSMRKPAEGIEFNIGRLDSSAPSTLYLLDCRIVERTNHVTEAKALFDKLAIP